MTGICVSVGSPSTEEALAAAREATLADWIEFRLDRIQGADLRRLIAETRKPVLVACPTREEGGFFEGGRLARARLLFRAAGLGAAAVDIDAGCAADLPDLPPGCKRIVSFHDWQGTPEELLPLERRLRPLGDVVKIATTARRLADGAVPLRLLEAVSEPTIAFAMGEKGRASRALAPLFGSMFTYASAAPGGETAPGQWTAAELRALYPPGAGRKTAVFGVVGSPLDHSLSPAVHGAAFRALNLDAVYLPFPAEDFEEFARAFRSPRFRGFSITHPYKEAALALSSVSDPHARAIGAANTWLRRDEGWEALNTDGEGALAALEKGLEGPVRNRLVLVLGAGGAGRAIAFECRRSRAEVVLAGRDLHKTREIADRLGVKAVSWDRVADLPYDVLVQATPVGMFPGPDESPVPGEWVRPGAAVMEIIYRPRETKLLRIARERGARTIGGMEMFLEQAMRQFRLFAKQEPPERVFRAVGEAALRA